MRLIKGVLSTSAGATTYTVTRVFTNSVNTRVPANCTSVKFICYGGGGAGAGTTTTTYKGGGAGGQCAIKTVTSPTADQTLLMAVAVARSGNTGNPAAGNDSYIILNGSEVCRAKGGGSGSNANGGSGSIAGSVGDTIYYGGNGFTATSVGGGGGGAAGNGGAGTNATSGTGSAGYNDGSNPSGLGGNGAAVTGAGSPGTTWGGGGGGALRTSGTSTYVGGTGAAGAIIVEYTLSVPSLIEIFYYQSTTLNSLIPSGVTSLVSECYGGGGTGCGVAVALPDNTPGAGGAGGSYAKDTLTPLTAGQTLAIEVGNVSFGNTGVGAVGNRSRIIVNGVTVCEARGGANGGQTSGGIGSTTNCIGDTLYAGGSGDSVGAGQDGGGGGGAAGSLSAGGTATSIFGGSSGSDANSFSGSGGWGGSFDTLQDEPGLPGNNYGGGGGGAFGYTGPASGGNGGAGIVKLTWTIGS